MRSNRQIHASKKECSSATFLFCFLDGGLLSKMQDDMSSSKAKQLQEEERIFSIRPPVIIATVYKTMRTPLSSL